LQDWRSHIAQSQMYSSKTGELSPRLKLESGEYPKGNVYMASYDVGRRAKSISTAAGRISGGAHAPQFHHCRSRIQGWNAAIAGFRLSMAMLFQRRNGILGMGIGPKSM
jgi:hypothetical protein